jgi:hypothetical protein
VDPCGFENAAAVWREQRLAPSARQKREAPEKNTVFLGMAAMEEQAISDFRACLALLSVGMTLSMFALIM